MINFWAKKSPIRFEFNFPTSGRLLWLCPSLWTSRPSRGVRQMRRRCCSKLSPQAGGVSSLTLCP